MIEIATIIIILSTVMFDAGSLLSPDEKSVATYILDGGCVGTLLWLCILYLITTKALLVYLMVTFSLGIWAWLKHIFAKGKNIN